MNADTKSIKYAPVPLAKINPDEPLCADIYLKIGDKYIKFKEKQDFISAEKYNLFLSKDVGSLFITIEHVPLFMDWLKRSREKAVNELTKEVGEAHRPLVEKREEIKEKIYETFADQAIDKDKVFMLKQQVSNFMEDVKKLEQPASVLAVLLKQSESIAEHSLNVANISVFLSMIFGFGRQTQLEYAYMGGLFHDYGKAKIPPNILENPNNVKYSQAINDHPHTGVKLLRKNGDIPEQVLTIIAEHHEQFNGKGFPRGLRGGDLYDLSKIVAMANIFDNEASRNKNKPDEMYKIAVKVLAYDKGKRFEPKMAERAANALEIAFKEYKKIVD